ncbi:MAG: hypothetical protein AAF478_02075 [Pseudomonadota bacterium]
MKNILVPYFINGFTFLTNIAAVVFYTKFGGASAYGTYGIYIVFLAIFYVWELAVLKTALIASESAVEAKGVIKISYGVRVINFSVVAFLVGSLCLFATGNFFYPVDFETAIGGSFVVAIVAVEHLLSYPMIHVIYHLTNNNRFIEVYKLRFITTLLRHAFAWSVLLATGSIQAALIAIILKGIVTGLYCLWWYKKEFSLASPVSPRIQPKILLTILQFFVTAVVVIVLQEAPSVYIDRTFGRFELGNYRVIYDIIAGIWFLATIYPTILFSLFLKNRSKFTSTELRSRISYLSYFLSAIHVLYFMCVCAVYFAILKLFPNLLEGKGYFIGVVAGVSILGYNRFLIEILQSQGQSLEVLISTILSCVIAIFVFFFLLAGSSVEVVGSIWFGVQLLYLLLTKSIISIRCEKYLNYWWDVFLIICPIGLVMLLVSALPSIIVFYAVLIGVAAYFVIGLMLAKTAYDKNKDAEAK